MLHSPTKPQLTPTSQQLLRVVVAANGRWVYRRDIGRTLRVGTLSDWYKKLLSGLAAQKLIEMDREPMPDGQYRWRYRAKREALADVLDE